MGRSALIAATMLVPLAGTPAHAHTIIQELQREGRFSTLLAALDAAGLTRTVAACKSCTLLAPDNAAFRRLPVGTVKALLQPGNRGKLGAILTFHVLGTRVPAASIPTNPSFVPTLNASRAQIRAVRRGGIVRINGVRVLRADIRASNNIIHELQDVLWPGEIRQP